MLKRDLTFHKMKFKALVLFCLFFKIVWKAWDIPVLTLQVNKRVTFN